MALKGYPDDVYERVENNLPRNEDVYLYNDVNDKLHVLDKMDIDVDNNEMMNLSMLTKANWYNYYKVIMDSLMMHRLLLFQNNQLHFDYYS